MPPFFETIESIGTAAALGFKPERKLTRVENGFLISLVNVSTSSNQCGRAVKPPCEIFINQGSPAFSMLRIFKDYAKYKRVSASNPAWLNLAERHAYTVQAQTQNSLKIFYPEALQLLH